METIVVRQNRVLIGKCGENKCRQFSFTFSSDLSGYTVSLVHKRSKDSVPYLCQSYEMSGTAILWTVTSDDTAYSGFGKLEIIWKDAETDAVVKSATYVTVTSESVGEPDATPAEAEQLWYDKFNDLYVSTTTAETAAEQAKTDTIAAKDEAIEAITEAKADALTEIETQKAEVTAARTNADGTVYESLKARIDADVSGIKSDVDTRVYLDDGLFYINVNTEE